VPRAALSKIFDALKEAELAAQSRSASAEQGPSSLGAKLLVLTSGSAANTNASPVASVADAPSSAPAVARSAPHAWKRPLLWFALGVTLTAAGGSIAYRHAVGGRGQREVAASISAADQEQKLASVPEPEAKLSQSRAALSHLAPPPAIPAPIPSPKVPSSGSSADPQPPEATEPESRSSQPRGTRPHLVPSQAAPVPIVPASTPAPRAASAASSAGPQPSDAAVAALPESSPGFVLQVATMRNEENANALTNVLHQRNFAAFVSPRSSKLQYIVLVGVYADSDSARKVKSALEGQGLQAILTRWSPE
jgi:cell division septation protein DedD